MQRGERLGRSFRGKRKGVDQDGGRDEGQPDPDRARGFEPALPPEIARETRKDEEAQVPQIDPAAVRERKAEELREPDRRRPRARRVRRPPAFPAARIPARPRVGAPGGCASSRFRTRRATSPRNSRVGAWRSPTRFRAIRNASSASSPVCRSAANCPASDCLQVFQPGAIRIGCHHTPGRARRRSGPPVRPGRLSRCSFRFLISLRRASRGDPREVAGAARRHNTSRRLGLLFGSRRRDEENLGRFAGVGFLCRRRRATGHLPHPGARDALRDRRGSRNPHRFGSDRRGGRNQRAPLRPLPRERCGTGRRPRPGVRIHPLLRANRRRAPDFTRDDASGTSGAASSHRGGGRPGPLPATACRWPHLRARGAARGGSRWCCLREPFSGVRRFPCRPPWRTDGSKWAS